MIVFVFVCMLIFDCCVCRNMVVVAWFGYVRVCCLVMCLGFVYC